jgi:hypothetical protein
MIQIFVSYFPQNAIIPVLDTTLHVIGCGQTNKSIGNHEGMFSNAFVRYMTMPLL